MISTSRRPIHKPWSLIRSGITLMVCLGGAVAAANPHYPITDAQRGTARQVADGGVAVAELTANAPDNYTVKAGDTLWDISKLFLRSPWRWPALWGMNLEQINNPHLIYPGQLLVLVKNGDRARLQLGQSVAGGGNGSRTVRLSPHVRSARDLDVPIATIPRHLIQPFLSEAVVLDTNELEQAPAIVAGREGRVLMGRGDIAYVRGELPDRRDLRVFRTPHALTDPETGAILGYEAAYVGAAQLLRSGETITNAEGKTEIIPSTVSLTSLRQEAVRGDRLALAPDRDDSNFAPQTPGRAVSGSVVSIFGEGVSAGQYQVVALNRGRAEGLKRGHVLAIQHTGERITDPVNADRAVIRLPDERHGHMMVFRVYEHLSYALIMSAQRPVTRGDRFSQP